MVSLSIYCHTPSYFTFTPCPPKVFFIITFKTVNEFPSNLAVIISDKCLTARLRTCPLHLTYVCTLPCDVTIVKIVTKMVMSGYS